MKRGIVVSDLHLLSWRSRGMTRFEKIRSRLDERDVLVLNGDTFDFRWALRSHADAIPLALTWLSELISEFPRLDTHFITGNHDCLAGFTNRLTEVQGLSVHPHFVTLGRNLFLHGDAANYRMDLPKFRRFRQSWENDAIKGKLAVRCYDLSDRTGLNEFAHKLYFPGDTAVRRIAWHLDQIQPGWSDHVDDCFFGHTHLPFQNRERDGVRFHNTGSGLRGMGFAPAEFTFT